MSALLFVIAAPGLSLPIEGQPRDYVTDSRIVPVPATPYFRKALTDNDLVEMSQADYDAQEAGSAPAAAKAGKK